MKKIYTLLLGAFFLMPLLNAQVTLAPSVIASAGGYAENDNISLSWTLGEIAVSTLYGNDMILTQGFQQPFTLGTSINLNNTIDWNIKAFPNPVEDELKIQFDLTQSDNFWIEVQDVTGRTIELQQHKEIHPGDIIPIDMTHYQYGVYFFKIFTPDRKQMRVLSIRKI